VDEPVEHDEESDSGLARSKANVLKIVKKNEAVSVPAAFNLVLFAMTVAHSRVPVQLYASQPSTLVKASAQTRSPDVASAWDNAPLARARAPQSAGARGGMAQEVRARRSLDWVLSEPQAHPP